VREGLERDLGFGAVVSRESRHRLLNRDGSFNVVRGGLDPFASLSLYHFLLTVSWPRFLGLLTGFYFLVNGVFAAAYVACGPGALTGTVGLSAGRRILTAFFFSVQTFATIGYGTIAPQTIPAHVLVTLESLTGLLGVTLATGILFARFARPTALILFSDRAVIAPYNGSTAFEFRIANARSNELVELEAAVMLSRLRPDGSREFVPLELERRRVAFFPLSWTVVHPIQPGSPLHGLDEEDLLAAEAEFLIQLHAFDETFSQTVQTRSSYRAEELVWGARFANIFNPPLPDGRLSIDVSKLHELEPHPLPGPRRLVAAGEG